ncbi:hypothetical protein [Roseiflexus sp.]|uniref:hypothetical protein n=1 Tax=Roseiflexus sp. TaxID=2562120 RepID=UPI0021DE723A|nr:hypothetical protein [Roseiflexus sp.]GIW02758.1 MAG: hypothetical protein KatS3mg058_4161 [Roseiflexus sp.]
MEVVAGLNLSNLKPRVWDPESPYYLADLHAVMVSYADFHRAPARRRAAMNQTLRNWLGVPPHIRMYLDNGAFFFLKREGYVPQHEYEEFVRAAQPDWYPIPQDFIPTPQMDDESQQHCLRRTMKMNLEFKHDGFVPVMHIGRHLTTYIDAFMHHELLAHKKQVALGGIVPNLLRAPKAMPYLDVLRGLLQVRRVMADKQIHVFGIGGTATLHLAALFQIDSVDSSGWRNRAARGIVQLPGRGDRVVARMGSWRGREPDAAEWRMLEQCRCPACQRFGIAGLTANGIDGFCHRATHNLWVLLQEARAIDEHLKDGTYRHWHQAHIENSIYGRLLHAAMALIEDQRWHPDGSTSYSQER